MNNNILRYIFLSLALSLFFTANAQNDDENALISKAKEAYEAKDYKLAVQLYEQLVVQGFHAPQLNYNLANAYYKNGNFTKAILNYERAIKLDPDYENASFNLKFANQHLRDQIEPVSNINFSDIIANFVTRVGLGKWAIITLASLFIGALLFGFYFFSADYKIKKFAFSFGFVFCISAMLALGCGFYNKSLINQQEAAIIIEPVVTAKSSPDDSGTDLFRVHEGLKVAVKDNSGEWVEVRIADGRTGWIKKQSLEVI